MPYRCVWPVSHIHTSIPAGVRSMFRLVYLGSGLMLAGVFLVCRAVWLSRPLAARRRWQRDLLSCVLPVEQSQYRAQLLVDQVLEALHALGHTFHNISDVNYEMAGQRPRQLTALSSTYFSQPVLLNQVSGSVFFVGRCRCP